PLRPELELTHQERESISPMLSDHLGAEGCRLLSCSRAWLIGVPRELEISTVTTAFAAEHEWSAVLPQGRDAPWVRRTMTELQMLLHEHPVNESRAARDKPTVNALWLWGHG